MNLHTEIGLIKIDGMENKYTDYEGYYYSLTIDNMKVIKRRSSSPAKFFRNNPYTMDNIRLFLSINSPNVTVVSELFDTATSKHQLTCCDHGLFEKSWNEIKNGQYCPTCGINFRNKSKINKIEDIIIAFREKGYQLISDVYYSNNTHLHYICDKHKENGQQKITWGNFISGKGCHVCARESQVSKQTKPQEVFESQLFDIFGEKYVLKSSYITNRSRIEIRCNDCNIQFSSKAGNLLKGHMGCRCKSGSLGEDKIIEFLEHNNIIYTGQFRIGDCKNKKPLPFDFAVFSDIDKTELLYLIEFQGKQHYLKTGWSSDDAKNEECFIKQQKNDQIKRDYCSKNKIELIEIPYWKINEIDDILTNLLLFQK